MTFPMPFWDPVSDAGPPTTITIGEDNFSGGTGTASISVPEGSCNAGDLLIFATLEVGIGLGATVIPAGFTELGTTLMTDGASAFESRLTTSYKIADGSEVTLSANLSPEMQCLKIVTDSPITSVNVGSHVADATTGDPAAQVVTSASGAVPLAVVAFYGIGDVGTMSGASMSPAEDNMFDGVRLEFRVKVYNSSPADVTVDLGAGGEENHLHSCYFELS